MTIGLVVKVETAVLLAVFHQPFFNIKKKFFFRATFGLLGDIFYALQVFGNSKFIKRACSEIHWR